MQPSGGDYRRGTASSEALLGGIERLPLESFLKLRKQLRLGIIFFQSLDFFLVSGHQQFIIVS